MRLVFDYFSQIATEFESAIGPSIRTVYPEVWTGAASATMLSEAHQTGTMGPRKGAGKMIRVPKTLPLVQKVQHCAEILLDMFVAGQYAQKYSARLQVCAGNAMAAPPDLPHVTSCARTFKVLSRGPKTRKWSNDRPRFSRSERDRFGEDWDSVTAKRRGLNRNSLLPTR